MKIISVLSLILSALALHGQIDAENSKVQAIAYWSLGEKHDFKITNQKIKYTGTDTTSNETMTCRLSIEVIDSTASTYTLRWKYSDFRTDTPSPFLNSILEIGEQVHYDIQTNELGTFVSLLNWEEVRDKMHEAVDAIQGTLRDSLQVIAGDETLPDFSPVFDQMKSVYSTKASIENGALREVQQLLTFHGGAYELGQPLSVQTKVPNVYDASKPLDATIAVELETIDESDYTYLIRMQQETDPEQLADAAYTYINGLGEGVSEVVGEEVELKRSKLDGMQNSLKVASWIHDSGWVINSHKWVRVVNQEGGQIETTTIQMEL